MENAKKQHQALIDQLRQDIFPERFRRSKGVLSADDLIKLLQSRVLVVGCGGLGGHVAALLARQGVGHFRLCDPDIFEESNINRQLFCTTSTLGLSKVAVAASGLKDIAPYVEIEALPIFATPENLPDLTQEVNVVLDCLDSLPAKFMLEKAAMEQKIPFVHGAVLYDEGFAFLHTADAEHCRSQLASMYPPEALQKKMSSNVSSIAPAAIACLMVSLAVSALIRGKKESPLLHFDCSIPEMETFPLL